MVGKKGGKGAEPSSGSTKEQFWSSLSAEDAKLAKAWDCGDLDNLQRIKAKKEADEKKARDQQYYTMKQNERKQQWEKEEAKKQRDKAREESKWLSDLEKTKQRALRERVVEAWYDESQGKSYAEIVPGTWKEVQGEFYCTLCDKCPNGCNLESHLNSEAHKKKLAWAMGATYALVATPASAATPMPQALLPLPPPVMPEDLPAWQQMGPDGLIRCIPCGKVVDDNHLMTGDHGRRLAAFLEQEKLKQSGYAPPELEYLAWVPCDENDPNSERWMKCLLCSKWVQDDVAHSGIPAHPAGSKEHQKNLRNYEWYRPTVLQQRQKYHPVGGDPRAAAKAPAKAPPPPPPKHPTPRPQATMAPWAPPQTKAPPAKQPPPPKPVEDEEEEVEEC
ncbi:unnamed protein product [Symbiodinium sp. CCMP2592]|nr:unnamed protein product [Symbiodinium sp. CCMP2592]